jgi:hypothetical protein
LASAAIALGLGLATVAAATPAEIARAGGDTVSCAELAGFAGRLPAKETAPAPDEREADRKGRLLDRLLAERRLARAAEERGLDADPAFVERIRSGRERVLLAALDETFAAGVEIGLDAAWRYYEKHRDSFRSPERIASRLILLRLAADAPAAEEQAVRERLERIRKELRDGTTPFAVLARQHSEAENARRGGAVAASPRGRLLAEFEEVAWSLAPGEVSEIVRLPDGLALILVEQVFAARERGFEVARPGIEQQLRREETAARRRAAVDEARRRWPARVDWRDGDPVVHWDGKALGLEELGLGNRPPRLRERLEAALDGRWLVRLAEARGVAGEPAVGERLRHLRRTLLASSELEHRVAARLPEVPEARLRELYGERSKRFTDPELRSFEVVVVPGTEGRLRPALARAEELAEQWHATGRLPDGVPVERWGPLERSVLGNSASPRLAATAFDLAPGELSAPLRLERYQPARARFEAEGYVVLRLAAVRPAARRAFAEVREALRRLAVRRQLGEIEAAVRAQVLEGAEIEVDAAALAGCRF